MPALSVLLECAHDSTLVCLWEIGFVLPHTTVPQCSLVQRSADSFNEVLFGFPGKHCHCFCTPKCVKCPRDFIQARCIAYVQSGMSENVCNQKLTV